MANLKRGTTFVTGQGPTPEQFNNHMDDALLFGVTSACNASGVNLAKVAGGPGGPPGSDGEPQVELSGELTVYNGSSYASIANDMSVATTITLKNQSGNATLGDVVAVDRANSASFDVASSDTIAAKVIGALGENSVAAQQTQVRVRGICPVRVSQNFSGGAGNPGGAPPGTLIFAMGDGTSRAEPDVQRNQVNREAAYFGLTLYFLQSTAIPGSSQLVTCYIWK